MAAAHWLLHNEASAAGCYVAKQIAECQPAASWQISFISSGKLSARSFIGVCVTLQSYYQKEAESVSRLTCAGVLSSSHGAILVPHLLSAPPRFPQD